MIALDSNIFVYVSDSRFVAKQAAAVGVVETLSRRRAVIGLQTVGETQNVLLRKLKVPPADAAAFGVFMLQSFECASAVPEDAAFALAEMAAGRLSYWDALLLSTVARAGCTAMMTEDLQDGATILGVEIVNPFADGGLSERAQALLGSTA